MRTSAAAATTLISLLIAIPALAQGEEDCPPGSWFCEEPEVEPGEGPEDVDEGQPEPPEVIVVPSERRKKPPPVVVYRPKEKGDPTIVVIDRTAPKAPPPPKKRWKTLWGLNLHLEGALMGSESANDGGDAPSEDAGMGGFGLGLRYRPKPHFAFEVGMDFLAGNDYQGHQRTESALLFNGIVFFNPKDKFQIYGLGGFGFSNAQVTREMSTSDGGLVAEDLDYSYFGVQMGLGAELMLGKRTALSADVIGFIRGRTDALAQEDYEFYDEDTGRGTNTSGGGLFRAGITFYW